MSLDFDLHGAKYITECIHCDSEYETSDELFSANITHNLTAMAGEVKLPNGLTLYDILWRPEEHGKLKGADLVESLEFSLAELRRKPEHYKTFDSDNGWGIYEHFVPFVASVLEACKEFPDGAIRTCR